MRVTFVAFMPVGVVTVGIDEEVAWPLPVQLCDERVGEPEAGLLESRLAGDFFRQIHRPDRDAIGTDELVLLDVGDLDFGAGAAGDEVAPAGGELAEGFAGDRDVGGAYILNDSEPAGFEDFLDLGFACRIGHGLAEVFLGDQDLGTSELSNLDGAARGDVALGS